jgi:hypothetical protein
MQPLARKAAGMADPSHAGPFRWFCRMMALRWPDTQGFFLSYIEGNRRRGIV